MQTKPRVIVGLSGGVDSSVTALLLKEKGFDVIGLFMKNWEEDDADGFCSASQDILDAKTVCEILDIPFHIVNFSNEYWDNVFSLFLSEYRKGRTPNPDVLCNKEIKFKCFLEHALTLGADHIATGHYARIQQRDNQYYLLKGKDQNKDQSYFLYLLGQKQLSKSLFPLGELLKPEVRRLAEQARFPNHKKKDSTGICFIGERRFKDFLQHYLPAKPGRIETPDGEVLGEHDGLMFYTIGQRQGLNIGGRKEALEAPWYVFAKDLKRNALIVGQEQTHPLLYKTTLTCQSIHWITETPSDFPFHCQAKIRYRQTEQACFVKRIDAQRLAVNFVEPQRAVTPGQSIVFYQDEICLGGGVIE